MAERPEDLNLPNAVVTRIIKEAIPNGVSVSKEARLAVSKAASVFVLYATSCSNNFALKNKRKTISAQDVLSAMEDMEFEQFIEPLQQCQDAFRAEKSEKRKERLIKIVEPADTEETQETEKGKKKKKEDKSKEDEEGEDENDDEGTKDDDDDSKEGEEDFAISVNQDNSDGGGSEPEVIDQ